MEIFLKDGVNTNIKPELGVALGWIRARWDDYKLGEFVLTSGKDSEHTAGSQHKQDQPDDVPGEAVDIRTRHLWNEKTDRHDQNLIAFARMLQTTGLKVIVHRDWLPEMNVAPHLHVGLGTPIFKRLPVASG